MGNKTIEDMVHDYAIASIQSGKSVTLDDVKSFCLLARDVNKRLSEHSNP